MKRKVIQIANSTQLISLPRKWSLAHNIKKGEELEVKEEGNVLMISTGNVSETGSVEVDVSNLDRDSLMFLIRALYKNGYDEIILNFSNSKVKNVRTKQNVNTVDIIMREVSRLNGMELFNQKENRCVLKSLSEDSSKVFDTILRRVFILTQEAIEDLRDGFRDNNIALLESIQSKHDTITRFTNYTQRLLHKVGDPKHRRTDTLYHILEVIDELMDIIKYNARDILKLNIKASKQSVKIYDKIVESFGDYYRLFYSFNLKEIARINETRYNLVEMLLKTAAVLPKKELMILTHMEQVLEKIMNLVVSTMSFRH